MYGSRLKHRSCGKWREFAESDAQVAQSDTKI